MASTLVGLLFVAPATGMVNAVLPEVGWPVSTKWGGALPSVLPVAKGSVLETLAVPTAETVELNVRLAVPPHRPALDHTGPLTYMAAPGSISRFML